MTEYYPHFDLLSYQLGMAGAFCEMVQQGVKALALSPPIEKADFPRIQKALQKVAAHYQVCLFPDDSFLPSELAHEEALAGKTVVLLYKDPQILSQYQSLKALRAEAIARGDAPLAADQLVTPPLRRLLGYPH